MDPEHEFWSTHLKDLKTSNIQDSYEVLARKGGVQGPIDPSHQPLEHAVVGGFGQSADGVVDLPNASGNTHVNSGGDLPALIPALRLDADPEIIFRALKSVLQVELHLFDILPFHHVLIPHLHPRVEEAFDEVR